MDAVKLKIQTAQDTYDSEVRDLEKKLEDDKFALEERIVNGFLKNII